MRYLFFLSIPQSGIQNCTSLMSLLNSLRVTDIVRDPDPEPVTDPHDPHVFGLSDPDPFVRGADPDPSLFS
jgi:hypothetical protein